MKTIVTIIALLCFINSFSQKTFFQVYSDSVALVNDANHITKNFVKDVNLIKPVFSATPEVILNTQPYLIFYTPQLNQVSLPIWDQVIPEQKKFFEKLGGSQEKGREIFGLFFNGFFLTHELGHALQTATNINDNNLYENEYFANIIAILYWRKANRNQELKACYKYAKMMVDQLPNPVPAGEDPIKYFNENYEQLGSDPYKYGYYQFSQIVQIYEDENLNSFDEYMKNYLSN